MAFSLTWLPDVLRAAGLKVAEVDGWQDRGRAEMGKPLGVICHHTATNAGGNMPTLQTLIDGRSDLPGPLSQLGLGRDGTFYVVAAGRCNHAGKGEWQGVTDGNGHFIGIEAENTGLPNDFPWPVVQMEAYQHGVAAILKHLGQPVIFCAGHLEYALPKGRKNDPDFDMDEFRSKVAAIMAGGVVLAPIPSVEPDGEKRPTLRRGSEGDFVKKLQRGVGVPVDGSFGPKTEAAVRAFQRAHGIVPDGIVGPKTWAKIDDQGR